MRYLYGFSVLALALLAGCKNEPPPPPEAAPPPPKTAQEMYNDYKTALTPLLTGAGQVGAIGPGMKDPVISAFTTARSQYSREEHEPEALERIEKDVTDAVNLARDNEQWFALDGLLDVHQKISPKSQRYQSLRRRADLMMARPWVYVTGFAEIDKGDLVVFLTIIDPLTNEQEDLRVREGEEFYPDAEGKSILRLVKVIGAQSGVELEYLKLPGETWAVPGPKNN